MEHLTVDREGSDLGRELAALLRSYESVVGPATGDLPHGARGYQVLREVVHGDRPSQLALAAHLGIDRTVMTYLLDDLEAAGVVERRPNPADRRQRQVVATPKGRRLVARLCAKVATAEDTALDALSPAERSTLRALVHKAACSPTLRDAS